MGATTGGATDDTTSRDWTGLEVLPLDAGIMQHLVTFEVDQYDEETRTGWSVLIKGRADLVTDAQELAALEASGVRPWSSPTVRNVWVTLHANHVSGRRITPVQ